MGHRFLNPLLDRAQQATSGQYYAEFNGTTSEIDCGSDASLDDLHAADFTVEGWFYFDGQTDAADSLVMKGSGLNDGWSLFRLSSGTVLYARVNLADGDAQRTTAAGADQTWKHIAMTYDDAAKSNELFIDGVSQGTGSKTGAAVSDAAGSFMIGRTTSGGSFQGRIAWVRVSDTIRYTTTFTPAAKNAPPAIDANTVEQWNLNEGAGSSAAAQVNSSNNGALTDVTWGSL